MPSYGGWSDVPIGAQLETIALKDEWEQLVGYQTTVSDQELLNIVNAWGATTLTRFSEAMKAAVPPSMPWAIYGLSQDQYQSLSTTFGSEYKKVTGQDISPEQLAKAFTTSQTGAGGLLTGSEYGQQLTSDKAIQDTYGWVKYGLDYNQFQQQKLGMQQAFGQPLEDHQAVAQLAYFHANQGSDRSVRAQTQQAGQKTITPGEGQSEVR